MEPMPSPDPLDQACVPEVTSGKKKRNRGRPRRHRARKKSQRSLGMVLHSLLRFEDLEEKEADKEAHAPAKNAGVVGQIEVSEVIKQVVTTLSQNSQQDAQSNVEILQQDLQALVQAYEASLREQLFARIARLVVEIPDVAQRSETSFNLVQAFMRMQRWDWASNMSEMISHPGMRDHALLALKQALAQAQEWERAIEISQRIKDQGKRNRALGILCTRLIWAQQWERAEQVVHAMQDSQQRARVACQLGESLAQAGEHERLLRLIQRMWSGVETREEAIELLGLVRGLLPLQPALSADLLESFAWTDNFLQG